MPPADVLAALAGASRPMMRAPAQAIPSPGGSQTEDVPGIPPVGLISPDDVAGVPQQPRSHEVYGPLDIVVQAARSVAADNGEEQAFTDTHYVLGRMPPGTAAAIGAAAVVQLALRTNNATSSEPHDATTHRPS